MPIKDLSNLTTLPRLGKIHLGIKVDAKCPKCGWEGLSEGADHCPLCSGKLQHKKGAYPRATDYFVVPEELAKIVGERPSELDIMFPVDSPEIFAPQWLRAYSMTQGLVCIGDGETSRRKVDKATGAMASHETEQWEWREGLDCDPQTCPEYICKPPRCRRVMNLMVLLPQVPGLGVWQIDTSSFYSIRNINSMVRLLQSLTGRCSFIPLKLCLGPIQVSPSGQKQKRVHIMYVKNEMTLAQIALMGQRTPAQVLIPEPDLTDVEATFFAAEGEEEVTEVSPVTPRGLSTEQPPTQVKPAAEVELIEKALDTDEEGPPPAQAKKKPTLAEWSSFWARCHELRRSPDEVQAILKKPVNDWLNEGKTLDEALEIIEKAPKQTELL